MKPFLCILILLLTGSTGLSAEHEYDPNRISLDPVVQVATNTTLLTRLHAGEYLHWEYGITNALAAIPASAAKRKVQVVRIETVQRKHPPSINYEQLREQCFNRSSTLRGESQTFPHYVASQWVHMWTTGSDAPPVMITWFRF